MSDGPRLYILMRNDMDSMSAGKACAQAAHAANQFVLTMQTSMVDRPLWNLYAQWRLSTTGGFGTTIVLTADLNEIKWVEGLIKNGASQFEVISGWVHDPTYPVKDGNVMHYIPVDTCFYVFGDPESCKVLVDVLPLY